MKTHEERIAAIAQMEAAVTTFYRQAVSIGNHPFIEFAGVMTAYVKSCQRAHEQGIDFTECNRHAGIPLPMESFEVTYLNEKLDCIFDGRMAATEVAAMAPLAIPSSTINGDTAVVPFDDAPWAHLYAQENWHDDAAMVGTRLGLIALRDTLTRALATDSGHANCELFANDGEGYLLTVSTVDTPKMMQMANPYSGEARETRMDVVWPAQLVVAPMVSTRSA